MKKSRIKTAVIFLVILVLIVFAYILLHGDKEKKPVLSGELDTQGQYILSLIHISEPTRRS